MAEFKIPVRRVETPFMFKMTGGDLLAYEMPVTRMIEDSVSWLDTESLFWESPDEARPFLEWEPLYGEPKIEWMAWEEPAIAIANLASVEKLELYQEEIL